MNEEHAVRMDIAEVTSAPERDLPLRILIAREIVRSRREVPDAESAALNVVPVPLVRWGRPYRGVVPNSGFQGNVESGHMPGLVV